MTSAPPDADLTAPAGYDLGCDVTSVADVETSLHTFGDRYLARVFTAREVTDSRRTATRLAARFAAKEAVVKLFRDPGLAAPFHEIEVVTQRGLPSLLLHGSIAAAADERWDDFSISLSHNDCHAIAVVLARRREGQAGLSPPEPATGRPRA